MWYSDVFYRPTNDDLHVHPIMFLISGFRFLFQDFYVIPYLAYIF